MIDTALSEAQTTRSGAGDDDPVYRLSDFPLHYMATIKRKNLQYMTMALRPFDVNPQEWRILASLRERDRQAVSELADIAVLERTRASRIVDSLVERGLVLRSADNGDKRFALVGLTDAGRARYEKIVPVVRRIHGHLISGISDQDFSTLMLCLRKMKENAFRTEDLHRLIEAPE